MSDFLPQELLIAVLKWLPPKSLIRFRCVCKSWSSLISSPYFTSLYKQTPRRHHSNDLFLRFYSNTQNAEIYSIFREKELICEGGRIVEENPFRDATRCYCRIVGTSNGVLCLSNDLFGHTHSIFLWNPIVRRRINIPLPKKTFEFSWPCVCVLGFGFDPENDDFKVVRVAYAHVENGYSVPPKVEVYSLRRGNWRRISGKSPRWWMVDYFWSQAFVNGNVHWIGYRSNADRDAVENLIVVFDLTHEVFDEMSLPNPLQKELPFNLNTAVVGQTLAIYQYDARVSTKSCSIWVMKQYGNAESWSRDFKVDIVEGLGKVVGVTRNHCVLVTDENGELILYNQVTEKKVEMGITGTKYSFDVSPYVETLALLEEGEAVEKWAVGSGFPEESDAGGVAAYRHVESTENQRHSTMALCLSAMVDSWYM